MWLLAVLREHRDEAEADLQRYYSLDLGDYYRRELSPRRLSVLLTNLPPESALIRALSGAEPGWDLHAFLLSDLFHAFTGEPHPNRPKGGKGKATAKEKVARLLAQQERLESERQAASE